MLRNGLEPWHLLVVAIMVILLFGSKKLPDAARGLGKSMRILKSEAKAMKEESNATEPLPAEPTTVHTVADSPTTTATESPTTAH